FWLYAIYYTLGRVWIEAMRIDDAEQISLFGITARLNVWTSIFVLLVALIAFVVSGLRKPSHPDTPFVSGRQPAADDAGTADAGSAAVVKDDAGTAAAGGIRHSDFAVSDSESRDNLPDNQRGPGDASAPAEASEESTGGSTSVGGVPATGAPGHHATGSAPEAGGTK
ncbi:MAG: prolipoprotein diacylglyceryl transferase, partial [Arthrobacter sp.]|nr:prolipoprotein diacylglyceryl transferase [Arthrobacter sp.]